MSVNTPEKEGLVLHIDSGERTSRKTFDGTKGV